MCGLVDEIELYNTNIRIKDYVDKYMKHHGIIELESALKCMAVKNYIEYVKGGNK